MGCSEPDFWDGGGFYKPLSTGSGDPGQWAGGALLAGAAGGLGAAYLNRNNQADAKQKAQPVTIDDMRCGQNE